MGRPGINPRAGQAAAAAVAAARTASSGSLHAGEPMPTIENFEASRRAMMLRRQTTQRYHTFPTPPPKTPHEQANPLGDDGDDSASEGSDDQHEQTPLPLKQLGLLAVLSLAEQTALNSISPYLPEMVASFPGVQEAQIGVYVGTLASAFALAQLSTNFLWGYLSDVFGRKPTMVLGTFLLMCCFVAFGFCKEYWQIIVVHVAMGMLNGNAAVVPTVLGEVTDRSNQSRAFTWLPVVYSLGGITGPALGGLLVGRWHTDLPYLAPNLVSAAGLFIGGLVVALWFEETLESMGPGSRRPSLMPKWLRKLWPRVWGSRPPPMRRMSWSARWPRPGSRPASFTDESDEDADDEDSDNNEDSGLLSSRDSRRPGGRSEDFEDDYPSWRKILNRNTVFVLLTYLVFQLANISFNGLYPIFAAAKPPTGRGLSPGMIGVSLSIAGIATIIFQAFLFQTFKAQLGNLGCYRLALLGFALSMAAMPFIGYRSGDAPFGLGTAQGWLYSELAVVLIIKNICAVGGLSSVMLLITNCAPTDNTLGTLNGIAQSLSAAGRSIGPFVSGGLFTLAVDVRPKGEAVAWGTFGGIAFLGWLMSLGIRHRGLESEDWVGYDAEERAYNERENDDDDDDDGGDNDDATDEHRVAHTVASSDRR